MMNLKEKMNNLVKELSNIELAMLCSQLLQMSERVDKDLKKYPELWRDNGLEPKDFLALNKKVRKHLLDNQIIN